MCVKVQMESGHFGEAVNQFAKYGMHPIPQNYPIYKTLALEIFVDCDAKEVLNLRSSLYGFMKGLETTNEVNTPAGREFNKYLVVAHLLNLKNTYRDKGLLQLYARVSVGLLRYCDLVRLDMLYLDAGEGARKQNWLNLAFVLLNRYLDIFEVIEDPENNNLGDNTDFNNTDVPSPYDVPLPEKNVINEQKKEEIRDWLLQVTNIYIYIKQLSINQKVEQILPTRQCENCGQSIFEASLRCNHCKNASEPCIISGYPLVKGQIFNCQCCGKGGLKEYWNLYLQAFANCPWCNQTPK